MSAHYKIQSSKLELSTIYDIIYNAKKISLSDEAITNIENCRNYLDHKLKDQKEPIYGINTGFGALHNVKINKQNLNKLQENLVMSHACGMGDLVPLHVVKLMLLLKIQSLSYGYSGVHLRTVNRLVDLYNNDILPVIYTKGSLGASGDLAPLAHLALPLLGKGKVHYKGEITETQNVYKQLNWESIMLDSKEGLALLNGTQFMSAYGIASLLESYKLAYLADLTAAISLDAFNGRLEPFDPLVHFIRPHNGQIKVAERIMRFLEGSEIAKTKKKHVQDPYSFRCVPQVHGATLDTLNHVANVFITEINAVTDNPNIFESADKIISGGNFHGQPLAITLDFLKIAMAELGNISERRVFQLVSGNRELPLFLVKNPGLNSGFMIPQYTAASIVSANKQLATPASIDSIVSSNGQEDHVSMGANAATQVYELINNVKDIVAIELCNASQALYFRQPLRSSDFVESFLDVYREDIPILKEDSVLHDHLEKSLAFIDNMTLDADLLFI
ncbi:MAG: histidine ammonia-lyase [Winogradskyella sp.]|nr:histidine ammonia-lyase [Winogradskyella sp.]